MTHDELIERALKWLRGTAKRTLVASEVTNTAEVADAIGWNGYGESILIECKVSRSDFFADRKKLFRRPGSDNMALGDQRWYMTPPGLIDPSEVPDGWGLLEAHPRCVKKVVKAPIVRSDRSFKSAFRAKTIERAEHEMAIILRVARDAMRTPEEVAQHEAWKESLRESSRKRREKDRKRREEDREQLRREQKARFDKIASQYTALDTEYVPCDKCGEHQATETGGNHRHAMYECSACGWSWKDPRE